MISMLIGEDLDMAIDINRTISDGGTTASFELVTTGGGDSGTLVNVSALAGAYGNSTERVMVKHITAFVCPTSADGGCVTLSWSGSSSVAFLTIPPGFTSTSIVCDPRGLGIDEGNIDFEVSDDTSCTLRVTVERIAGYPANMIPKTGY